MAVYRVSVIVLNFRGETTLFPCLASLKAALDPEDQIILVDNGQETALMEKVHANFPQVVIHSLEKNRGFAMGMNAGLRLAAESHADAFWLMNNDAVVDEYALTTLKEFALRERRPFLASPLILDTASNEPWFAGGKIDFLRMRTVHTKTLVSKRPYQTGFLTGCALFIPRATFQALGLLDERFFLYYEDAEYSLRAKRRALPLWVVPSAEVWHREASRENPEKLYWLVRSGVEFFFRESRGLAKGWVFLYFSLRKLKNRIDLHRKDNHLAKEVARAYTDASPYA